jgi:hypothetical protein
MAWQSSKTPCMAQLIVGVIMGGGFAWPVLPRGEPTLEQ